MKDYTVIEEYYKNGKYRYTLSNKYFEANNDEEAIEIFETTPNWHDEKQGDSYYHYILTRYDENVEDDEIIYENEM